jgi:hypothetical protein
MNMLDYNASMKFARKEGVAVGTAMGRDEGIAIGEARLNRVKKLIKKGLSGEDLLRAIENIKR